MMKTDAETGPEKPAEDEPASPASDGSPQEGNERDLDELRRFRVRTVPPDMRRQWMLAETPVVSTLELQDTVPPNQRPSTAPLEPAIVPPRPLFDGPRVSSTAATRRLPTVAPRSERATTVALIVAGLAVGAVLFGLVWAGDPPNQESVAPQTPVSEAEKQLALEPSRPVQQAVLEARDPAPSPPTAAPSSAPAHVYSAAGVDSTSTPSAKARASRTEQNLKLQPAASGKIPPAQKPRSESDIKSPLFGK
jgi:hypothetical protein